MKSQNFSLFIGCLGNGITVCNRAVMEGGDFKHIAHIGENGKITWYVKPDYTPEAEKTVIENAAAELRCKYLEWWSRLSIMEKYGKLLNMLPMAEFLKIIRDRENSMEQTVSEMEKKYIQ